MAFEAGRWVGSLEEGFFCVFDSSLGLLGFAGGSID